MIPGRFHAETFVPFDVEPGEIVTIPLIDQDGKVATQFVLPMGDTDFDYEISDVTLDSDAKLRPTRAVFDPYRLHASGSADDDRTGRSIRAIVPPMHQHASNATVKRDPSGTIIVAGAASSGAPGTSTWADTFSKHEFVNVGDGPFELRVSHNGTGKISIGKVVFHATNADAKAIHRHEGFSAYSDGLVRSSTGKVIGPV